MTKVAKLCNTVGASLYKPEAMTEVIRGGQSCIVVRCANAHMIVIQGIIGDKVYTGNEAAIEAFITQSGC